MTSEQSTVDAVFQNGIRELRSSYDVILSSEVFKYEFIGFGAVDTENHGAEVREYEASGMNLELGGSVPEDLKSDSWHINYSKVYGDRETASIDGKIYFVEVKDESAMDEFSELFLNDSWRQISRVNAADI